jgi:hypothetical protein
MSANGTASVLWWPGRLLAEDDLRRHWTSQREIFLAPKTIVTPLALDFLKVRHVAIRREEKASDSPLSQRTVWGIAVVRPSPSVTAAVKAVLRDGLQWLEDTAGDTMSWVRSIADRVRRGDPPGAVIVCEQADLAACLANKVPGVRAAAVSRIADVTEAKKTFGPSLFVVAAAGLTYFELRQLLKLATDSPPECPERTAKVLAELDHAHR